MDWLLVERMRMKYIKKLFLRGSVLLYISFAAISMSFLLLISVASVGSNTMLSQNSMYTGHELTFSIYDSADDNIWNNIVGKLDNQYNDYAIYCPIKGTDYIIRGIYLKGKVATPPMLWGDYFDNNTSWSDEPLVVVGSSHQDTIWEKGNNKYISYNGVDYRVIGVMGTHYESRINEMLFINFKSAIRESGVNTEYVLDTYEQSDINTIGKKISSCILEKADCVMIIPEEGSDSSALHIISKETIMDVLYLMVFLCYSLCTIIITEMWLKYRSSLIMSHSLCGYKKIISYIDIIRRYGLAAVMGCFTGIAAVYAFSVMYNKISISISDIMLDFIITVGLGGIFVTGLYALKYQKNAY